MGSLCIKKHNAWPFEEFKTPFSVGISEIFSNFTPYFVGHQGKFVPPYFFTISKDTFLFHHLSRGIKDIYTIFFHFKDAFEFDPVFHGEMRTHDYSYVLLNHTQFNFSPPLLQSHNGQPCVFTKFYVFNFWDTLCTIP